MTWVIVVALGIGAATIAGVVFVRRRARRAGGVIVPADLGKRVIAAARALSRAMPWQPSSAGDAPAAAAAIEAALIAREPRRALELAETAIAASHDDPAHRVWLAWALVAHGQPAAALDQLGQLPDDAKRTALARYLDARAEHLRFEHASGAVGSVPPLITTGDLAVVTLARGRGGAAWLTGSTEIQLSSDEVKAAIAEHREITARCLDRALRALEREPGFVDAAYLVARLAVKAGLVEPATALFDAIAPKIAGRPDAESFERDRHDLADPSRAVANAKLRPVSPTAKRSRSLKVL
ncbi:MAG TPA: hypothetical protein VFQ53_14380 [Kofleriaceae bacterium]|nr:hypothetical protein [Kofleriaceae bacterium]